MTNFEQQLTNLGIPYEPITATEENVTFQNRKMTHAEFVIHMKSLNKKYMILVDGKTGASYIVT